MEIEKLSIADLKASWDFVKEDLKEFHEKSIKENISIEKNQTYNEIKIIENKLYHQLLNLTRNLK